MDWNWIRTSRGFNCITLFYWFLFAGTGWVLHAMIGCNLDRLLLLLHEPALHWLLLQINYALILLGGVAFPYDFTFEAYGLFHLRGDQSWQNLKLFSMIFDSRMGCAHLCSLQHLECKGVSLPLCMTVKISLSTVTWGISACTIWCISIWGAWYLLCYLLWSIVFSRHAELSHYKLYISLIFTSVAHLFHHVWEL